MGGVVGLVGDGVGGSGEGYWSLGTPTRGPLLWWWVGGGLALGLLLFGSVAFLVFALAAAF